MKVDTKVKARIVSLTEAYDLAFRVAQKIKASDFEPDVVIAIARGGFPPARFIADFLAIKNLISLQLEHYSSGAEKSEDVRILDEINLDLSGKKVLIADDVNDTGDTLIKALDYVSRLEPGELKTSVLHEKSNTRLKADIVGDFLHEWQWLIYQWAALEDVKEFLQKDGKKFNNRQEAEDYLRKAHDLTVPDEVMGKVWELVK